MENLLVPPIKLKNKYITLYSPKGTNAPTIKVSDLSSSSTSCLNDSKAHIRASFKQKLNIIQNKNKQHSENNKSSRNRSY